MPCRSLRYHRLSSRSQKTRGSKITCDELLCFVQTMATDNAGVRELEPRLLCYSSRRASSPLILPLSREKTGSQLLIAMLVFFETQNLIYALECSLKRITETSPSMEERFVMHKDASKKFKAAALALGFKQVANNPDEGANGMTALYVPEGATPADVVGALARRKIVIAGGLHKDIKTKYVSLSLFIFISRTRI